MRALLYYPTINMPIEVLFRGILDWERIGSVPPPDHAELLTTDMRRAEDAGVNQALRLSGDDPTILAGRFHPTVRAMMSTLPAEDWAARASDIPLAEYLYGPKVPAYVLDDLQQPGVASASLHNGQHCGRGGLATGDRQPVADSRPRHVGSVCSRFAPSTKTSASASRWRSNRS